MTEKEYQDRNAGMKLIQELQDEENAELAAANPEWDKELKAIHKAMEALTEAGVPFVLFAETHQSEYKPFTQFNNFDTVVKDMSVEEADILTHEHWWKLMLSCLGYFSVIYPEANKKHGRLVAGLTSLHHLASATFEEWQNIRK